MEQKQSYIDYLEYAIQSSYNEFFSNGMKNEELLKHFLADALYTLYSTGKANRFARAHRNYLQGNVQKDEIFNYLVQQYIPLVKYKSTYNLKDPFQQVVKKTLEDKGEEETKKAIKDFFENGNDNSNIDKFSINDTNTADAIKRYNVEQLKKIMCFNCVETVMSNPTIELFSLNMFSETEKSSKEVFTIPDFAAFGEKTYDIAHVITAMEAIRSGKIKDFEQPEI